MNFWRVPQILLDPDFCSALLWRLHNDAITRLLTVGYLVLVIRVVLILLLFVTLRFVEVASSST